MSRRVLAGFAAFEFPPARTLIVVTWSRHPRRSSQNEAGQRAHTNQAPRRATARIIKTTMEGDGLAWTEATLVSRFLRNRSVYRPLTALVCRFGAVQSPLSHASPISVCHFRQSCVPGSSAGHLDAKLGKSKTGPLSLSLDAHLAMDPVVQVSKVPAAVPCVVVGDRTGNPGLDIKFEHSSNHLIVGCYAMEVGKGDREPSI